MQTRPDITCGKCGTVVPWGPYCPHCNAYLEFAGTPPWSPDAPEAEPDVPPDDAVAVEEAAPQDEGAPQDEPAPAVVTVAREERVPDEPADPASAKRDTVVLERPAFVLPTAPPVPIEVVAESSAPVAFVPTPVDYYVAPRVVRPSAWRRLRRGARDIGPRQVVGYLAAIVIAGILVWLLAAFTGWDRALYVAPVLVLWGVLGIAIFGTMADGEEALAADAERARVEREEAAVQLAAALAAKEAAAELELVETIDEEAEDVDTGARQPQELEDPTIQTRTVASEFQAAREVACLTCGRMNVEGRHFCDYCGETMEGAVVMPPVAAHLITYSLDSEAMEKEKKKQKRRLSGSWRNPIMAGGIVVVVVTAFAFAFFGPGAFTFRFGMTRVYQTISRWIDPYVGDTVSITSVVASSTLPGTNALEASFSDGRTFWASDLMPGYGAGTTLIYTFTDASEVDRMVIFPGIQSKQFDIRALATPKDITLQFDDGSKVEATLDSVDAQTDQRQLVRFDQTVTSTVTLTIDSVYPPRGHQASDIGSVAISGTEFLLVPPAPPLFGFQRGPVAPKLPGAS